MAAASAAAPPPGPVIFISAGEPSGDLHGAALVRALRRRFPHARFLGLGGARMAAEGVELLAGLDELAVMGFVEVARHLPFFLRLRKRVFQALEHERVSLVVPIDYPGFNLRLARHARRCGVPVLYYIAPQVWAWHASRARHLAEDADAVAVILPFEAEFLRRAGARAEFVGHPLLDVPPPHGAHAEWAARHGLDPRRPVLALFPGSRRQEIARHLQLFAEAAARVTAVAPAVQPVIGASPDLPAEVYTGVRWPRVPSTDGLLHHATAALVKSGTSTLEAALAGTPLVVAYRMNPWSYRLAKRLVKVPHIALANLVADKRVAPELVQEAATPEALRDALLPLLDAGSPQRAAMLRELRQIRETLGGGGAADRVAELAAALLARRS